MKYQAPKSEGEILPNKLDITDSKQIEKEEYRGFLRAELKFESEIENIETFDWHLITAIHHTALEHLYEFAGKLRKVNLSKDGFLFPAARYLGQTIQNFEEEFLNTIPKQITDENQLVAITAPIHAELLFIHPFREGNGRTARLFINLIAVKHGYEPFDFDWIRENQMEEYIISVQSAAEKNYRPMKDLFTQLREKRS
jgi:cell filamentation protein